MFLRHLGLLIYLFLTQSISFAEANNWEDSQWLGIRPDDVNPDINNWKSYDLDFVFTPPGSAPQTVQSWVASNTNYLDVIPATTTVDGKAKVSSVTQYVQFATTTATEDGQPALQTDMLVTPQIWSAMGDAAADVCGAQERKRQFCDLSKISENDIAAAAITRLASSRILLPTLAIGQLVSMIKSGE